MPASHCSEVFEFVSECVNAFVFDEVLKGLYSKPGTPVHGIMKEKIGAHNERRACS